MKRKSPSNYRRKKRSSETWRTITMSNISDSDCIMYYDSATPITWSTREFTAGDIISISGAGRPKQSKKVHPARRRIPQKGNNGEYIIGSIDNNNSIILADDSIVTLTGINDLATATKIANDLWTVEVTGCVV